MSDTRPHNVPTALTAPAIEPNSFYGKLRKTYSDKVLKTQLEQLKKQGSYDAFDLQWHPAYDVNRLHGGKVGVSPTLPSEPHVNSAHIQVTGNPPSLFWESDVGKWYAESRVHAHIMKD